MGRGSAQLYRFPNHPGRGCHLGLERWPATCSGGENIRTVTLSPWRPAPNHSVTAPGDGRRVCVQMSPGAAGRRSDGCVGGLAWPP
jgi:hypothetical protein